MVQETDVIVIGAGISGSTAAYVAAKLGCNVTVCEEHPVLGEPAHCSGHVGIKAMKGLGLGFPKDIIENEIRGAKLYSPSGIEVVLERKEPVTWVLNRLKLDEYVGGLAQGVGANYMMNTRVEGLYYGGDTEGVKVLIKGGKSISAKLVIDAGGARWKIGRSIGVPPPRAGSVLNSAQLYVDDTRDVDSDFVEVYYGGAYAPGFFAWIIPRHDGSAKVGLAVDRGDPKPYLRRFMTKHPIASKKIKSSRITRTIYHPIPVSGGIPKPYANRYMAVGDAAAKTKPTTGGGIVLGIISGAMAGRTAYRAILAEDYSQDFLSLYEKAFRKLLGFDLAAMSNIRLALTSLSDDELDRVFKLARRFGLQSALSRLDDIDFQGKGLVKLIRDPRLAAMVVSMAPSSLGGFREAFIKKLRGLI